MEVAQGRDLSALPPSQDAPTAVLSLLGQANAPPTSTPGPTDPTSASRARDLSGGEERWELTGPPSPLPLPRRCGGFGAPPGKSHPHRDPSALQLSPCARHCLAFTFFLLPFTFLNFFEKAIHIHDIFRQYKQKVGENQVSSPPILASQFSLLMQ